MPRRGYTTVVQFFHRPRRGFARIDFRVYQLSFDAVVILFVFSGVAQEHVQRPYSSYTVVVGNMSLVLYFRSIGGGGGSRGNGAAIKKTREVLEPLACEMMVAIAVFGKKGVA